MDKIIDDKKYEDFLEILKNQENINSNFDQEILFITTDSWLAQLGTRRKN